MKAVPVTTLEELVESGAVQLTRGKIISKRDIAACPGNFPIYSSAKDNDGKFGEYGKFLFDEELITWSVDGGGRLFHRPKHKFSVTNVGGVLRIRDRSILDYRYLYFVLTLRHSEISFDWVRKAHPSVIKKLYQNIPLPPLTEQRRIVGILDEAFEGLATAKTNAEQNLQNACALFESHLQAVFTQRGEGWVDTTIGAEIKFIDYRGKTPVKTASGVRLITAKNVKMGYLQEKPREFIAAASYKGWMTRGIPQNGDVLFTTEAPLANVAQLDTDEKVAFAQRIIIMQPNAARLDNTFLKYLLLSQPVQQSIRTRGTGATVQGIKASLLKLIEISFPKSLAIQEQIVSKLDGLREETHRLDSLYQRKLAALDELKKSLLHRAFNGELTKTNVTEFPVRIANITPTDLHAGIIAIAYQKHQERGKLLTFHHVKAEKIVHLAESFVGIELDRKPIKNAAGPNDFPRMHKVEHRAKLTNFFHVDREGDLYSYTPGRQVKTLINKAEIALGDRKSELDRIIDLMVPMKTQSAEILATVFAGWNNLLLDGLDPSDEEIVTESRENWHPEKLTIDRERFFRAIKWMREHNVVPAGKGKKVLASSPTKKSKKKT